MTFPPLSSGYWLDAPIAVLRLSLTQLAARGGSDFKRGEDDLAALEWAILRATGGRIYALVRREHSPAPGTEVLMPSAFADDLAALGEVLSSLNLTAKDLAWSQPSIDVSILRIAPSKMTHAGDVTGKREAARKVASKRKPAARRTAARKRR